ncbi:MAG: TetR family transcriptional regulator [Parasporobacterium sp.]|nr:TetR family transcriptional regulator [Parasporobacterium sp.]
MKKRTSKEIFADTLLDLSRTIPVDRISVKQIVEESGLSLQTFYNHFRDKQDLIMWISRSEGERMISKMKDENYGADELILDNIRFYLEREEFMETALPHMHDYSIYARQSAETGYRMWSELIIARYGQEVITKEIDFYLKIFCYTTVLILAEWKVINQDLSEEEILEYIKGVMPQKLKELLLA